MARRRSWADYIVKVSRGTIEGVKVSRETTGQPTITAGAAPPMDRRRGAPLLPIYGFVRAIILFLEFAPSYLVI